MNITLERIYRYPIKSLSVDSLQEVSLRPNQGLDHDRSLAFLKPQPTPIDLTVWHPPRYFLSLKNHADLAKLTSDYHPQTRSLSLYHGQRKVFSGSLDKLSDRQALEQVFDRLVHRGVSLVESSGIMFADDPEPFVSILNRATLDHLQDVLQTWIDPIRFRPNFLISGTPPWGERSWIGKEIAIDSARLYIAKEIVRCQATNVDPDTGVTDLNIPRTLQKTWQHCFCGVLALVTEPGVVRAGSQLRGNIE